MQEMKVMARLVMPTYLGKAAQARWFYTRKSCRWSKIWNVGEERFLLIKTCLNEKWWGLRQASCRFDRAIGYEG